MIIKVIILNIFLCLLLKFAKVDYTNKSTDKFEWVLIMIQTVGIDGVSEKVSLFSY
jgi:hypothetical protein